LSTALSHIWTAHRCAFGFTGNLPPSCYAAEMTMNNNPQDSAETQAESGDSSRLMAMPTRRRALMLGAVAASAVVSVRPALAQTAGSVLNCQIPVAGPQGSGMNIDATGDLVAPTTPGSFPQSGYKFTGEQVKNALNGGTLPGTSYEQNQAYLNYIRRLQAGQSGFTCYASLQMPR
jgi:hypothetical protein